MKPVEAVPSVSDSDSESSAAAPEHNGLRACDKGDMVLQGVQQEDVVSESHVGIQLGDGLWGRGAPLPSVLLGKRRDFADGFGLCSPGRWPPKMRRSSVDTPSLGFAELLAVELLKILSASVDIRRLAMKLAAGKVAECPFSEELVNEGRELLFLALEMAGTELPVRERPEGQPFFLAAIEELLRISGDPDSAAFYTSADSFAKGVKLGVDVALPRVPAVFEEKVRHRKYGEDAEWQRVERANYVSAAEHASEVQAQFEEEEKLGAMIQISAREASKRYGDKLRFASLGAIEKKDGTKRVTHDATHGVGVNSAIQLKDQVRCPAAGDLRTALMTLPRAFFGLTGDVKRAHRLVKLATSDWGYTACRTGVQGEDMLWLNTAGTFGVSSVAFHWCRLMGGLGRAAYYLIACLEILHMVYSDDLFWLTQDSANGIDYIVLQVFFYVVVGVPFSWKKFCGGIEFAWVGFCVSIKDRALGISERRATWLVDWLKDSACETCEDCRSAGSYGQALFCANGSGAPAAVPWPVVRVAGCGASAAYRPFAQSRCLHHDLPCGGFGRTRTPLACGAPACCGTRAVPDRCPRRRQRDLDRGVGP